jgi:hypothetical protein
MPTVVALGSSGFVSPLPYVVDSIRCFILRPFLFNVNAPYRSTTPATKTCIVRALRQSASATTASVGGLEVGLYRPIRAGVRLQRSGDGYNELGIVTALRGWLQRSVVTIGETL